MDLMTLGRRVRHFRTACGMTLDDLSAATGTAPPLFAQVCQACHAAGVAGAPKIGDKAPGAPLLAQGIDGMTATVIKGKGAMPPKGGSTASEGEIKAVVTYMANASK